MARGWQSDATSQTPRHSELGGSPRGQLGKRWGGRDPAAGLFDGYDEYYRDAAGRQPGDPGFVAPCGTGGVHRPAVTAVVDPAYRDVNGKGPGEAGFIPPSYDESYRDAHGRRPGQQGFVPPFYGSRGSYKGRESKARAHPSEC